MPSDYELSTEPGDGQGIAVGEFTLADGTVSLILPKHWELLHESYRSARFAIPELRAATLVVKIKIYDDSASIAANDLLGHLHDPGFPTLSDDALDHVRDADGRPDFEKLTIRARGVTRGTDGGEDRRSARIWHKLGLLRPNAVRLLAVQLRVPESEAQSPTARETEDILDHLLKFVRFADHETAADRIAPGVELRQESLWDVIAFRVPADWPEAERENDDGTGMYVYDDKEADRWTLWVDYNLYRHTDGEPALDAAHVAAELADGMKKDQPDAFEIGHDPMPGWPGEALAKVVYGSVEKGETLRHVSWHKVTVRGAALIMAHFTLVVPEAIVADPDIIALTALLECECRNAVLVDREADALQRPAAGHA